MTQKELAQLIGNIYMAGFQAAQPQPQPQPIAQPQPQPQPQPIAQPQPQPIAQPQPQPIAQPQPQQVDITSMLQNLMLQAQTIDIPPQKDWKGNLADHFAGLYVSGNANQNNQGGNQ